MSFVLPLSARVPGSSANLGPGFDVFGVALDIHLEARALPYDPARPLVRCSGPETEGIALDESNLVLRAFRLAFERAGCTAPRICLDLHNPIPLARGLGSSGAAIVAGVVLAGRCGELGMNEMHQVAAAAELENGHPDNVAASLLGGFTIACRSDNDRAGDTPMQVLRLDWPASIRLVLAIPDFRLETTQARAVLPGQYSRADAVFNLQRVALLAAAIASGRPNAAHVAAALDDRLHQPYRAPLAPGMEEARGLRVPGLLGVALSGAGPALVAFVEGDARPTCDALSAIYARMNIACDVRPMAVAARGAEVKELSRSLNH